MEEEIKALIKVVNDLVEQNNILIQILLSRPQNPNHDWFDQMGKINRERCRKIARDIIGK